MSRASQKTTRFDSYRVRLHNSPLIATILIVGGVVVGIAKFTGGIDAIRGFIDSWYFGRTPALRAEYCELLRPLTTELDRTKAAFDRWNGKDLSLESETIRDGNLKARTLLRDKGQFVMDSLREHQRKLIDHYDKWLEEYDRVRVRRTSDPNQAFVFVYSFPGDSEKAFRERLNAVEAQLGAGTRCY